MILAHITALSKNHVIGIKNKLPWHLPSDLKHFKEKTTGHIMIMGRKTFESFPNPLPQRFHIVITRQQDYIIDHPQVYVVKSLDEALKKAESLIVQGLWPDEVFVVGGGQIYKESLSLVSRLYLTLINREFDGDAYYPEIPSDFVLRDSQEYSEPFEFAFTRWERKS